MKLDQGPSLSDQQPRIAKDRLSVGAAKPCPSQSTNKEQIRIKKCISKYPHQKQVSCLNFNWFTFLANQRRAISKCAESDKKL